MKIRSITYFYKPEFPIKTEQLKQAGDFIIEAHRRFEAVGYEVQTSRLATTPFADYIAKASDDGIVDIVKHFESAIQTLAFDYVSLGPALPNHPKSYQLIPEALSASENTFFGGMLTTPDGGVSLPAVRACAEIIHQAATISPDGFANLRFAALANVPPGAPFFPAAYHEGVDPSFALALEAADLAVQATEDAFSLEEARNQLIMLIEENASELQETALELSRKFGLPFGGIDFTLAPFPEEQFSFGKAMENLGLPVIGVHGSLAAAAFLADTLDRASFQKAGFNGLMLPVLEDAILARRATEGTLTVKDLLLYSTVCGTGLDTVPLPGETSVEEIYAVLLDLATLSQRLDKPLTARLMPIPGKQAGDPTDFDFAYFANSRVLSLDAKPLAGLLKGEEDFKLGKRQPT
jgi:uncharacterized protein (UPF0210 family)